MDEALALLEKATKGAVFPHSVNKNQYVERRRATVPYVEAVIHVRDSADDKFLEVALNGIAELILPGDADLQGLHPWRGIPILSPADYLGTGRAR